MPILSLIGQIILSAAIFTTAETLIEKIFSGADETLIDEIFSGALAAGVITKLQKTQVENALKIIPLVEQIKTPQEAANFLTQLSQNKAGLEALNARLGGFAPLAIKFTQTAAKILPKLENITFKKVAFITSAITFLFWLPWLLDSVMEKGVYQPEQANEIMKSWGLPFSWPISETRATETKLEAAKLEKTLAGFAESINNTQPRIILRMAQTTKPQLFSGILFSAPLSKPEAFDRHVDDEITDLADLQNDLKLNLAKWIKGLTGRISVALAIRNNPTISTSEKLSGTWVVASISYNLIDGTRVFLDTIPLGPINPIIYMPRVSEVKTLENQIFTEFKPESIKELVIPPAALNILSKEGELISLLPKSPTTTTPTPAPAPAPIPIVTQQAAFAAGTPIPAGAPSASVTPAPVVISTSNTNPSPSSGSYSYFRVSGPLATTNVRSGAGLDFAVQTQLANGTLVKNIGAPNLNLVPANNFQWLNINYGSGTGWIAFSHLQAI